MTLVHGSFGDVVNFSSGLTYLSWYPSGMVGTSGEIVHPPGMRTSTTRRKSTICDESIRQLAVLLKPLRQLREPAITARYVDGGLIFAWGATDIDDPSSELHQQARHRNPYDRQLSFDRSGEIYDGAHVRGRSSRSHRGRMTDACRSGGRRWSRWRFLCIARGPSSTSSRGTSKRSTTLDGDPDFRSAPGGRCARHARGAIRWRSPRSHPQGRDRLGWVEHYNLLLKAATGEYFLWMPHDDAYPGGFIQPLVE